MILLHLLLGLKEFSLAKTFTFSTKRVLQWEKQKESFKFTFWRKAENFWCHKLTYAYAPMLLLCTHLFNNRPQRRGTDTFCFWTKSVPNFIMCINTRATHVIRVGANFVPNYIMCTDHTHQYFNTQEILKVTLTYFWMQSCYFVHHMRLCDLWI